MANDINELRDHLFDTLKAVKDGRMEAGIARAVCAVASEISKTAKLELDYMKTFDASKDSGFISGKSSSQKMISKEEIARIKGGNPLL